MNKKIFILLVVLVLIASMGCTQTEPKEKDKPNSDSQNNDNGDNGTQINLSEIKNILKKAENIDNIEYEVEMELNGTLMPMNMKVFQKGVKYRVDTTMYDQTQIGIYDGENAFTYDSVTDTYYQMAAEEVSAEKPIDFEGMSSQALKDASMAELGKEEVSGMKTIIIEFNYVSAEGTETTKTKAWISEEYGIPIKLEAATGTGEEAMKSTLTLKNIKVGSVDDSVFAVPSDKIKPYDEMWNTE